MEHFQMRASVSLSASVSSDPWRYINLVLLLLLLF